MKFITNFKIHGTTPNDKIMALSLYTALIPHSIDIDTAANEDEISKEMNIKPNKIFYEDCNQITDLIIKVFAQNSLKVDHERLRNQQNLYGIRENGEMNDLNQDYANQKLLAVIFKYIKIAYKKLV